MIIMSDFYIAKEDYLPGPYDVTFIAGMISVRVSVTIIEDITIENDENFTLTIDASSLPNSVSVGDPAQARVTIVEDSGK